MPATPPLSIPSAMPPADWLRYDRDEIPVGTADGTAFYRIRVVNPLPHGDTATTCYCGQFASAGAAFDAAMERFPNAHYIGVLIEGART